MKTAKHLVVILGAAALIAVVGIAAVGIIFKSTSENTTSYFSRIDNEQVEAITPHGGMNYRYSLQVYSEDGKPSSLDLDTSRILKDGAFIRIETAPIRGVIRWEELQYGELPSAVQSFYQP